LYSDIFRGIQVPPGTRKRRDGHLWGRYEYKRGIILNYDLRDYQKKGIMEIRQAYRRGAMSVCYTLPTGGGKTILFSHITEQAYKKGKSVFILVHRDNLLGQASEKLTEIGIRHGVISPRYPQLRYRVQVASVQTLVRRLNQFNCPDLIIIDECHHAASNTWKKIIEHYASARILGVTATPVRLDGKGLGNYFEELIIGPNIKDLVSDGYLSHPLIYAPSVPDMVGAKRTAGDYNRRSSFEKMRNKHITGCAVSHYTKLCPGEPAIAFCVSIEHANIIRDQFRGAGYKSEALHSKIPENLREKYINDLGKGRINVLTSCDIVSEGTDIPILRASILLRPTMSVGLYMQQVGRALRPYPGKPNAIILDHAGNCLRHGLPTDRIEWMLTKDKIKFEHDIEVRRCPICFCIHKPSSTCPECGHVYVVKKKRKQIEQKEGELKLINKQEVQKKLEKANNLKEIHKIAKQAGYKPGWAWIKWKEKQKK
jgi:superfamily II DNA or RNA helicase